MPDRANRPNGFFRRLSVRAATHAGSAVTRFPIAVLLIVAFSVISNIVARNLDWVEEGTVLRVLATLAGCAAASVAVRLAAESRASSAPTLIVAPLAAAVIAALALNVAEPFMLGAPTLVSALILVVPLAPFAFRGTSGEFWTFTLWTCLGVGLAFLSVLLFMLGFAAILEMVRYLFKLGLNSGAYEHIFTTAFTLVGPLFALGRIPVVEEAGERAIGEDRLSGAVRSLFDWVAAPLVLATAVILHLYAARILVTGELPRGEVGWIVTVFSFLVLGLRIAVHPFIAGGAALTRLFARTWAPALVMPLALLTYAIGIRVEAHGFTLERYVLAFGDLAAVLCVLVQLLPRLRGDIRVLAAVPLAILVLCVYGPWSGANVVGRSQAARIATIVAGLPGGDIERIDEEKRQELYSRIDALDEVDQLSRLIPLVPDARRAAVVAALADDADAGSGTVATALGLNTASPVEPTTRSFTATRDAEFPVGGFDRELTARWISVGAATEGDGQSTTLRFEAEDLFVRYKAVEDRFTLAPSLRTLPPSIFEGSELQSEAPVFDLVSATGRTIRVRVETITVDGEARAPQSGMLTVLIRTADWPARSLGGN